jgi:SAM-dependent methyltransferase
MHPKAYAEIERVVAERVPPRFDGRVLEVGAIPIPDLTLLTMPALASAERIGINLDEPSEHDGYRIVSGNANHMPQFEDDSFDLVLCNATLEHDPQFWLAVSEMHRVLAPGGVLVVGVPGYANPTSRFGNRLRGALTSWHVAHRSKNIDWLVNSNADLPGS